MPTQGTILSEISIRRERIFGIVMVEGGALVVHGGAATAGALNAARLMQSFSVVPKERLEERRAAKREADLRQGFKEAEKRTEAKRLELEAKRVAGVREQFGRVAWQVRKGIYYGPTPETRAAVDELRGMLPDLDEEQIVAAKRYLYLTPE